MKNYKFEKKIMALVNKYENIGLLIFLFTLFNIAIWGLVIANFLGAIAISLFRESHPTGWVYDFIQYNWNQGPTLYGYVSFVSLLISIIILRENKK